MEQKLNFARNKGPDFASTVRKRVNAYFKDNDISPNGDWTMIVKTIAMLSFYFVPFILMITGVVLQPWWLFIIMWVIMGVGIAGIGMSVMHDANHGAYSSNKNINKWVGLTLNLVGGYAPTWKIQHNRIHHTYTNVGGVDEDVTPPGGLLRFSPAGERLKHHRFQHIYGWFLYGLMTVSWITMKDFKQLTRYRDKGFLSDAELKSNLRMLLLQKAVYYTYMLVLPLIFLPVSPWLYLGGFFLMHFTAGFILGIVFQCAHVMPTCDYPEANDKGNLENSFAVHQVITTANFSPKSHVLSWYVGGLNFQIEHHLFPHVCHIHYKQIAPIVEETAKEFGIPYYTQPTFLKALMYHGMMLNLLGNKDTKQDIKDALLKSNIATSLS